MQLARVGVRVIVLVVDVVCLMLVFSARVVVHAVDIQFSTVFLSSFFLDLLLSCSSTSRCAYEHFFGICNHSSSCRRNILEGATVHRRS